MNELLHNLQQQQAAYDALHNADAQRTSAARRMQIHSLRMARHAGRVLECTHLGNPLTNLEEVRITLLDAALAGLSAANTMQHQLRLVGSITKRNPCGLTLASIAGRVARQAEAFSQPRSGNPARYLPVLLDEWITVVVYMYTAVYTRRSMDQDIAARRVALVEPETAAAEPA